jgi:hypothetical protein
MKTFYLIPLFALLLLAGCKDSNYEAEEEIETITDPAQHILGQWKEIARGNATFPELEPDGHIIEFLADGIYHGFWGNGNESTRHYRVDDEFLYLDSGKIPDGHTYRYIFTGINTLLLDYVDGAIANSMLTPRFHIYKRIVK